MMNVMLSFIRGSTSDLVAYADVSQNVSTGVSVPFPTAPAGPGYTDACEVMESGFPGLGIAWFNYNTATSKWMCASINSKGYVTRGINSNKIYDQIALVKIGPVGNGSGQNETFNFDKTFQFNERKDDVANGYQPDLGILYKMTLKGNTVVQPPICNAVATSANYNFTTTDAVNKKYITSPKQVVNIVCSGVIENGSRATFYPVSKNGVFSLDENYFATSNPGVGILASYTLSGDPIVNNIKPNTGIHIPITDNKATINFMYTPYIKNESGIYPETGHIDFNLNLNN